MKTHRIFLKPIGRPKGLAASLLLLALLLAMAASNAPVVHAATITVNSTEDTTFTGDGKCTLREALLNAVFDYGVFSDCTAGEVGADVINITAAGTILLTSDLPAITDALTISGPGQSNLILDGNGAYWPLFAQCSSAGCSVMISDLTVRNGKRASGSAIFDLGSNVTLSHVTVTENTSPNYGGVIYCGGPGSSMTMNDVTISNNTLSAGGAAGLYADSNCSLLLNNVTFDGNTSSTGAGGMYSNIATLNNVTFKNNTTTVGTGGAIYALGTITVTNSVFTNNRATNAANSYGGAVHVLGGAHATFTNVTFDHNSSKDSGSAIFNANSATTTIVNSTIADNSGAQAIGGFSGVTLKNTIVSNNTAGNCNPNIGNVITDGGGNLNWASGGHDCPGILADPQLGTLASNGGPVQTRALSAGSGAINAGNSTTCDAVVGSPTFGAGSVDARGLPRREGFCDIGAFEAQPATLSTTAGSSPQSAIINTAFAHALGAKVSDAHSNGLGGVTVTYAAPASGPSALLSGTTASSDASGNAAVTATANALVGSYSVSASVTGVTPVTFDLTNTPWSTTTTITSDLPDASQVGQAVTVAFTVTSPNGTPTGNVTVSSGTLNCTATVAQGSCTLTFTTPGSKTLTATYTGEGNFAASTSMPQTHNVVAASTSTTITSHLPHPSRIGEAVTVVYTVTSPYGTPTGSVTVSAGTTNCTGTVAAGSCTLTFATPGDKTLTASYAGDGNFAASTVSHPHTVSNWGTYLPLMIRP